MKNPFSGLFRARDKPQDSVSAAPVFYFGTSGSVGHLELFGLTDYYTDGLLYRYDLFPTGTEGETEARLVLKKYEGSGTAVEIPAGIGVYRIESSAFRDQNSLQSVVIPSGVAEIGSSAFDGCAVLHTGAGENVIVVPGTVTKAESLAFQSLGEAYTAQRFFLVLPAGLTEFDIGIFHDCNAVLVAPDGSAVANALYAGWYYYYSTLEDAIAGINVRYQHYYVDGVEQPHVHYGRR